MRDMHSGVCVFMCAVSAYVFLDPLTTCLPLLVGHARFDLDYLVHDSTFGATHQQQPRAVRVSVRTVCRAILRWPASRGTVRACGYHMRTMAAPVAVGTVSRERN